MLPSDVGPKQLKLFGFIVVCFIGSIAFTKSVVKDRRVANYKPQQLRLDENGEEAQTEPAFDSSKVKPGFPLPSDQYDRKSAYEGSGISYMSRKRGDRLTNSWFGKTYEDKDE
ncbi:hypothetical protein BABINDRAFT_162920 [Babjeviella inositovora NRRL Y-12698]|uniref:Uncharacterized protein n=1 Tax=Babjeviella inositovora NRRL Y-12698 TaxID=984486 RepID=A0A1E3QKP0_9ASCO|nr:uncharacterized protein BABINDRAFT_162920 [Babjeviella inositovora NRRL Y-12698]ODQ78266.1 hypothetical protein BABINDRAFT_162920 [Babjeviella inositovora NRRL Y-12698]